jgi:PAS domain S-box-containing protein
LEEHRVDRREDNRLSVQEYLPHFLIFLAILVSIEAGSYLILRYRTSLARWGGLVLLSQALELAFYLLQWTRLDSKLPFLFGLVQALAYSSFCFFWLVFAAKFTRQLHLIGPRMLALLSAFPITYLLPMALRLIHGAVQASQREALVGSIMVSPLARGLPGILFNIYGYGIGLFSIAIILRFFSKSDSQMRKTLVPLLFGPSLLVLAGSLELAGVNLFRPLSIQQLTTASMSIIAFLVVIDLRFRGILTPALETVVDQMRDGVVILDLKNRIVNQNTSARRILGSPKARAEQAVLSLLRPESASRSDLMREYDASIAEVAILVDEVESSYELVVSRLVDAYDEPLGRVMVLHDVTERKREENTIKTLLAEKELLLRELHHRVKNNMASICGLLSLQASHLQEPSAATALKDAESRVKSMMLLFDELYRSEGSEDVSVAKYLPNLIDQIISNFPNRQSVKVEKYFDDFALDGKRMQAVGIIIYELLTNVMKYAFGERDGITIRVSAFLRGSLVSLEIRDDGLGMPEEVNFDNSPGFGLFLVRELAKQMKAVVRLERGKGTAIIIEFEI